MGATYENVSVVRDHHTYAAPGTTYDVNSHQLYLECRGQGGPTVVLFNGMGEVSVSWARIVDQTDMHTRVCTYDRVGQGWSDDVDQPQDGLTAAHDLHSLLQGGRRARSVRPGRSLHRWNLRLHLRRPVPPSGRRDGAAGLTNTVHQVVDSTHMGLLEDPAPAQRSAMAINQVVDAVRASTIVDGR
jgi:hypothetical protein